MVIGRRLVVGSPPRWRSTGPRPRGWAPTPPSKSAHPRLSSVWDAVGTGCTRPRSIGPTRPGLHEPRRWQRPASPASASSARRSTGRRTRSCWTSARRSAGSCSGPSDSASGTAGEPRRPSPRPNGWTPMPRRCRQPEVPWPWTREIWSRWRRPAACWTGSRAVIPWRTCCGLACTWTSVSQSGEPRWRCGRGVVGPLQPSRPRWSRRCAGVVSWRPRRGSCRGT